MIALEAIPNPIWHFECIKSVIDFCSNPSNTKQNPSICNLRTSQLNHRPFGFGLARSALTASPLRGAKGRDALFPPDSWLDDTLATVAGERKPSNASAANLPRVVFFDSNALFQLGPQFEHVDFAELLDVRKYLRFVARKSGAEQATSVFDQCESGLLN